MIYIIKSDKKIIGFHNKDYLRGEGHPKGPDTVEYTYHLEEPEEYNRFVGKALRAGAETWTELKGEK